METGSADPPTRKRGGHKPKFKSRSLCRYEMRVLTPSKTGELMGEILRRLGPKGVCKILKHWLLSCHPYKQHHFPCGERNLKVPDYWPPGCAYKITSKYTGDELQIVCLHLIRAGNQFNDAQFSIDSMQQSTQNVVTQYPKLFYIDANVLLDSFYRVARQESTWLSLGITDDTSDFWEGIVMPMSVVDMRSRGGRTFTFDIQVPKQPGKAGVMTSNLNLAVKESSSATSRTTENIHGEAEGHDEISSVRTVFKDPPDQIAMEKPMRQAEDGSCTAGPEIDVSGQTDNSCIIDPNLEPGQTFLECMLPQPSNSSLPSNAEVLLSSAAETGADSDITQFEQQHVVGGDLTSSLLQIPDQDPHNTNQHPTSQSDPDIRDNGDTDMLPAITGALSSSFLEADAVAPAGPDSFSMQSSLCQTTPTSNDGSIPSMDYIYEIPGQSQQPALQDDQGLPFSYQSVPQDPLSSCSDFSWPPWEDACAGFPPISLDDINIAPSVVSYAATSLPGNTYPYPFGSGWPAELLDYSPLNPFWSCA